MARRVDEVGQARRRDAIYAGLCRLLNDTQAIEALRVWDRGYAQDRNFAVIDYVNDVAAALSLPLKLRHELRMELYKALLVGSQTGPDAVALPSAPPAGGAAAAPAMRGAPVSLATLESRGAPAVSAAYVVFTRVVQLLINGLRSSAAGGHTHFVRALRTLMAQAQVPASLQQVIVAWCSGLGQPDALAQAAVEVYPQILHWMYVCACEAIGPVATDQLLTRAVAAAEQLPEAVEYPPRRLL